jgi:hypothetical protein
MRGYKNRHGFLQLFGLITFGRLHATYFLQIGRSLTEAYTHLFFLSEVPWR